MSGIDLPTPSDALPLGTGDRVGVAKRLAVGATGTLGEPEQGEFGEIEVEGSQRAG
ncbi:MAG: hypothetical protein KF708_06925 [Pirellulales bacterium]|nr:hypothetical protein [Pirellulales bacterium]